MIVLDSVKPLKVLMMGDHIIDRYAFVKVTGKSAKDAILASTLTKNEEYTGGIHAAAKHVRAFCDTVDIYTSEKINIAQKYIEDAHYRKVFSVNSVSEITLYESPVPDIASYDLVIVIDFGHGTMTKELIAKVSKEARFLAVNAQTNGTNYGYNLITKYPRADYVVLDELEARLAAQEPKAPLEDVILKLGYRKMVVTCGKNGAIGYDGAFERLSAMTETVVDTLGAGDAFLSVTAPFASRGASLRELLRIGNAAGAVKVAIVGHRASVTKEQLEEQLDGRLEHR